MSQDLLATRDGFGKGIAKVAQDLPNLMALSADLSPSLRLAEFRKQFPDRYLECGVAEQNLAGVAAGLILAGKIPFATSFAVFNPGRNLDQIRNIAYSNLNVKIVGGHAGLQTGEDGATHQALEDLAIMSSLPNFKIIVPSDAKEAELATIALANDFGPAYLRLGRSKLEKIADLITTLPNHCQKLEKFKLGKIQKLSEGKDLTIIASGALVQEAIKAALQLSQSKIEVEILNLSSIKPLDEKPILESLNKTRAVIVAAEHQINSGPCALIGQLVAKNLGKKLPSAIASEFIGVEDSFGESGSKEKLFKKYKLNSDQFIKKAVEVLEKKKNLL
jgi:transketolase